MSKNKAKGRPPLYETPEQLQTAVDKYFELCKGVPLYNKDGYPVVKRNGIQIRKGETPPTISGLSYYLGFRDRKQFTRQKSRGEGFRDVVLKARLRCEMFWEEALYDHITYKGATFMLSMCFGWGRDKCGNVMQSAPVRIVICAPKKKQPKPVKDAGNTYLSAKLSAS